MQLVERLKKIWLNTNYPFLISKNRKLKFKKYNPVKRKHEMFVEAKLPKHTK